MTTTKHIHHDVIIEWAKGATIQYYNYERGKWMDCPHQPTWSFTTKYRVKPTTKKYRVSLLKWSNGNVSVINASSEEEAKDFEESCNFVRWITDWIDYEV